MRGENPDIRPDNRPQDADRPSCPGNSGPRRADATHGGLLGGCAAAIKYALLLAALLIQPALAQASAEPSVLAGPGVRVVFEERYREAAEDVARAFPASMAALDETLGLRVTLSPEPTIILSGAFKDIVRGGPVVAFAQSEGNVITMDTSHAFKSPVELRDTLRHELAHLVLGSAIKGQSLPRWLNEGVSQWASGGVSEIPFEGGSVIERAVIFGGLIPLRALDKDFPAGEKRLRLAYEESLSFIEFLEARQGAEGIRRLLRLLAGGMPPGDAFRTVYSENLGQLEARWHAGLRMRYGLLSYLSNHIYTLLFVLAAAVTVFGFIRVIVKLRKYKDEEDDENYDEHYD